MSNYIPNKTFSMEFEGDTVTASVKPGSVVDIKKLSAFMEVSGDGKVEMDLAGSMDLLQVAAEVLPNIVADFQGLKDAHGQPVDLGTVLKVTYFMEIVSALIQEAMELSFSIDEKKPVKESPPVPKASNPVAVAISSQG